MQGQHDGFKNGGTLTKFCKEFCLQCIQSQKVGKYIHPNQLLYRPCPNAIDIYGHLWTHINFESNFRLNFQMVRFRPVTNFCLDHIAHHNKKRHFQHHQSYLLRSNVVLNKLRYENHGISTSRTILQPPFLCNNTLDWMNFVPSDLVFQITRTFK